MKRICSLIMIGLLVLAGFGVIASPESKEKNVENTETIVFSDPRIHEQGQFLKITVENANSWVRQPFKPMLPAYIKTFEFPFGTKIKDVEVKCSAVNKQVLLRKIVPASEPVPLIPLGTNQGSKNYEKVESDLYPDTWFSYSTGCGLKQEKRLTFLTIQCFPVRYTDAENSIYYTNSMDIIVTWEKPTHPITFGDEYDLAIITPEQFAVVLQPLVDHKNKVGVNTILKTTEEIYTSYSGIDKPEQIKYFIKDAVEKYGITYVLLIGGLNSLIWAERRDDTNQGTKHWHVPVRYSNLDDGGDPGFISDLYYADIYREGGIFEDWDSNDDGIFASWKAITTKDNIDLYPDVYVGRLACRNTQEVQTMVNKIIHYESSLCDPSWFNKIILIGGDTFNDVRTTNYYEGEVENQKALEYLTGFEPIKIWASHRDTDDLVPEPDDIVNTISEGCGFLFFAGHGSPQRWNTYWPESFDEERVGGLWNPDIQKLSNDDSLPICVVGGCHNSQFNVTALCFLNYWLNKIGEILNLDFLKRFPGWVYSPTPECFSWLLTRTKGGGTIATLGNTGLGYGATGDRGDLDGDGMNDPDCVEAAGGYLETQFFKAYGKDNVDILGNAWGQAITTFITVYPGMDDKIDCKTVQQWALLGDPSLKIGGYSSIQ